MEDFLLILEGPSFPSLIDNLCYPCLMRFLEEGGSVALECASLLSVFLLLEVEGAVSRRKRGRLLTAQGLERMLEPCGMYIEGMDWLLL